MKRQLKLFYIGLNGLILIVILVLWQMQQTLGYPFPVYDEWMQVGLAVMSALLAMVFPVWMRMLAFSAYHRRGQQAKLREFIRFERLTIISSALAFAMAPVAFLFDINLWVRYFVTFMAIYALYFSFPSDKKLNTDLKLFKLSQDGSVD